MIVSTILPVSGKTTTEKTSQPLMMGNTLYVGGSGPNNYTKIQDAVNDSVDGDTIYVFDDSSPYYENVVVNTSIDLIGEDMNTTIVQNLSHDTPVFTILADGCTFTGFFIKQLTTDLSWLPNALSVPSKNTIIQRNTIYVTKGQGIVASGGHSTVMYNIVLHAWDGIYVGGTNNNISYNQVEGTSNGFYLSACYDSIIFKNTCIGNGANGIWMGKSVNNTIKSNTLNGNKRYAGLTAWLCYGNLYVNNNFSNNENKGIQFLNGAGNTIIQNNFINNTVNAYFQREPRREVGNKILFWLSMQKNPDAVPSYKMLANNSWDGNFWDDLKSAPYIIHGRINILPRLHSFLERLFKQWDVIIAIELENYDYHPALEPYDIGVV